MAELARIIDSLNAFLWQFFICFPAVGVFYFVVKSTELGANPFRMFHHQRYYYLVFVHKKAVEYLGEGKSNEEIRRLLRAFRFPFQSGGAMSPKTMSHLSFVSRVLESDDLLDTYIIKYNFSYKDFKRLSASLGKGGAENKALAAVGALLRDDAPKKVEQMRDALAQWHTPPFIAKKEEDINISAGENETYIWLTLQSRNMLKDGTSSKQYVDALKSLQCCYPDMSIVKGKSSLSAHSSKPMSGNDAYDATSQAVIKALEKMS